VTDRVLRSSLRAIVLALIAYAPAFAQNVPIVPMTVCEILQDLASHEGKTAAVLGRYSFRETGLWVGEQTCDAGGGSSVQITLVENLKDGPAPPADFELDAAALRKKLAEVQKHTSLGKFRFGTPDYDRWAVIYGRVELLKAQDPKKTPPVLVFRGSGVVVFLTESR
jgi:hypothetical protein